MVTDRPLYALWVTNMWPTTGSYQGIFVQELAEALRAEGVAIDVELIARDRGRTDYLLAATRLRRRWRTGRYDLVHAHYGLSAMPAAVLPPRTPLVVTYHGQDINLALPRLVSRLAGARADRRIFVSSALARRWPSPRNEVLSCGVDLSLFQPMSRKEARTKLGLDNSRRYVLFAGASGNPRKNYPLFRTVVDRVRQDRPEVDELVLAVPGQPRNAVPVLMNAADLMLFTSRPAREGAPTVFREAMAVGLPIVSLEVGDARDLLSAVRPGAVIGLPAGYRGERDAPPELAERLAQAVLAVLDETRGGDGRSDGRARVAHLDWRRIAKRTREIYEEVAASEL